MISVLYRGHNPLSAGGGVYWALVFRQYVSRDAGVLVAHRLYADEACETRSD